MHFVTASKYLSIQKKMATFLYQDNIVTFRNIAGKKKKVLLRESSGITSLLVPVAKVKGKDWVSFLTYFSSGSFCTLDRIPYTLYLPTFSPQKL